MLLGAVYAAVHLPSKRRERGREGSKVQFSSGTLPWFDTPLRPPPPYSLLSTEYKSRRPTEATKRPKGRDLPNEIVFRNLKCWEIKVMVCPNLSNQNFCQIKVLLVDFTPGDFYGRTGRCLRVKGMRGGGRTSSFPFVQQ